MSDPIRRIAICTGGGDAPGLNAVIRASAIAAMARGWEVYGIRDGFNGIFFPERYPDGGVSRLTRDKVRGIAQGPVLVDPSATEKFNRVQLGRGVVLGGGVSNIPVDTSLKKPISETSTKLKKSC